MLAVKCSAISLAYQYFSVGTTQVSLLTYLTLPVMAKQQLGFLLVKGLVPQLCKTCDYTMLTPSLPSPCYELGYIAKWGYISQICVYI